MARQTTTPAEYWEKTDLEPAAILGTRTYKGVLYTGDVDAVNILTGETPADLDRSVDRAKAFADEATSDGPPRVAKAVPTEQAVEMRSPYVASVFFHTDITGGMDYHYAYKAAWESDRFDVTFDADYEAGDLTITVTEAE